LRPSITKSSPSARAAVGLGHREDGADRAGDERAQPPLLLRFGPDPVQQVRVALVGRLDVERQRPEQAVAGRLEDDRHAAVVKPEAAPGDRRVRREQPRGAGALDELEAQRVARTMRVLARIALARDDFVAHERADALAQLGVFGRQGKIDHRWAPAVNGRSFRIAAARSNIGAIARAKRSHVSSGRRPLRCRWTLRHEIAPRR
jgi:hypothetical protein